MDRRTDDQVRSRAGEICEYCRLPQFATSHKHQIDHIFAEQHGGPTSLDNLALACVWCNQHKGPNLAGLDPSTMAVTPLFHPRRDRWPEHFRFVGAVIEGLTPIGRASVITLSLNHPMHLGIRAQLIAEGAIVLIKSDSP
jgi:hypothetical protein